MLFDTWKIEWQQLFDATWKIFNSKFSHILSDMQKHKSMIKSQATLTYLEKYLADRASEEKRSEEAANAENLRRKLAVQNWLSGANAGIDQENGTLVREEYPGTGRWLLAVHKFQQWFDPWFCAMPLLWLNGIPGARENSPSPSTV